MAKKSNKKEWLKKVEKAKVDADLSRDEDLSIALMNIISLEEHFYFTAMKTGNRKYIEMLKQVRDMRRDLMPKIVKDPVGEEWCISKHLLAASMRLIEVGTKEMNKGEKEEAEKIFSKAFSLYSLFFAINLKLVGEEELIKGEEEETGRFTEMVKKIVDCCKEW